MSKANKTLRGSLFRTKAPTDLIGPAAGGRAGSRSRGLASTSGLRVLSMGTKETLTGIQFGSPSSPNATGAAPGSGWEKLLEQTASHGLSSAMRGTFGLADFGGIGTAISSLFKIFGGGSAGKGLPPLVEFKLPYPVAQTVYVGSSVAANAAPAANGSQVVQAVKQALLTSSSLNDVINDVIAEI